MAELADKPAAKTSWRVVCLWQDNSLDWCHQKNFDTLAEARNAHQHHRVQHSSDPSASVDLLVCEPGLTPKSLLGVAVPSPEGRARTEEAMRRMAARMKEVRS